MRVSKITVGLVFCALFFSCLGMENHYSINGKGSGKLSFQYKLSQMFKSMGKGEGEEGAQQSPLPLSKEELESSLKKLKGVRVLDVQQWEDESDIYVKGVVEFDSVEALNKSNLFESMPISLVTSGGTTTFVQLLSDTKEPVDQEALDLYKGFFEGYELLFTLDAPKKIVSANLGQISPDGRSVTYRVSMYDYVQITEKLEFRVSW